MHLFDKRLFLVGMPGSGKSTIGKSLAEALNSDFYDLDTAIEHNEGKSIPEIFEQDGEKYFRESEANNLRKLIEVGAAMGTVISTGGGTPCFCDNMAFMNEVGITVFLDVPNDVLIDRLMATDLSSRPKFSDRKGLNEHLFNLHNQRKSFYTQAQLTLSGSDISAELIITKLYKS